MNQNNTPTINISSTEDWIDLVDTTTDTTTLGTLIDLDDLTFSLDNYVPPQDITNERLDKIEKYLGILRPDPEKIEQYDLLKSLYEQYKAAEALLFGEQPLDEEEEFPF